MCDFAPRDGFDIHAAIREANIKTAGLFGWPRIRREISPVSPVIPSGGESGSAPATMPPSLPVAGVAAGNKGEGA